MGRTLAGGPRSRAGFAHPWLVVVAGLLLVPSPTGAVPTSSTSVPGTVATLETVHDVSASPAASPPVGMPGPSEGISGPFGGTFLNLTRTLPRGEVNYVVDLGEEPATPSVFVLNAGGLLTEVALGNGSLLAAAQLPMDAGSSVRSLAVDTGDHRVFVVGSGGLGAGWVRVIEANGLAPIAELSLRDLDAAETAPGPVAYDAATDQVFVADRSDGAVISLDGADLAVVARIACPFSGCAVTGLYDAAPAGDLIETTSNGTLVVISVDRDTVLGTIPPARGALPADPAYDSARGRLVTANGSVGASTFLLFNLSDRSYAGSLPGARPQLSSLLYDAADDLLVATDLAHQTEVATYAAGSGRPVADSTGPPPGGISTYFTRALLDVPSGILLTGGAVCAPLNCAERFLAKTLAPMGAFAAAPLSQNAAVADAAARRYYVLTGLPDEVTAIATSNESPVWTEPLAGNLSAGTVAFDPAVGRVYAGVANGADGAVVELNASTGAAVAKVTFLGTVPQALAADPVAHLLYVALADAEVAVVSTRTGTRVGTVPVPGVDSCAMRADAIAHVVYVANCATPGNVTVVDGVNLTRGGVLAVGHDPVDLADDGDGTLYVANFGSANLSLVDLGSGTVVGTIGLAGLAPCRLAVDPARHLLLATAPDQGSLAIVNTTTRTSARSLDVGEEFLGIAFDPASSTFLLPSFRSGTTLAAREVAPPPPPIGLSLSAGNSTVAASWASPGDIGGAPVLDYTAYVGPTAVGPWQATTTSSLLHATFGALEDGTSYFVVVRARNLAGLGPPSATSNATPVGVPYPPQFPRVAGTGPTSVELAWSPPTSTGGLPVVNYTVWSRPVGTTRWTDERTGPVPHATVGELEPATSYTFYVVASNRVGPGNPSVTVGTVTATLPPPGTGGTTVVLVGALVAAAVAGAAIVPRNARKRRGRARAHRPAARPPPAPPGSAPSTSGGPEDAT